MKTTVFDVVHMFSEQGISAVPIVDDQGKVLNLYETVDVIVSTRCSSCIILGLTQGSDAGAEWRIYFA